MEPHDFSERWRRHSDPRAPLQKTLVKLDSNVEKLGERLQYETQKLANYTKDLKEAEAR